MRKVLAVVALVGCDGGVDPNSGTRADGSVAAVDAAETPDADPGVEGMWRDTFHTTAGPVTAANSCQTAPVPLKVDPTTVKQVTLARPGEPPRTFTRAEDGSWTLPDVLTKAVTFQFASCCT